MCLDGAHSRRAALNAPDVGRDGEAISNYVELHCGADTAAAVALLTAAASAHPTRSLFEFSIGTDRLALPIADHGIW
jgi:hypothetical protein